MEEQERESSSMGKAVKLVKGKVGKPKVKKLQLEETLPSPFGRRVEPQITLAMKADASKKMIKKKKVREKERMSSMTFYGILFHILKKIFKCNVDITYRMNLNMVMELLQYR